MRVDVNDEMETTVSVANMLPSGSLWEDGSWNATPLTACWHEESGGSLTSTSGTVSKSRPIRVQIAEEDSAGYVSPGRYDGIGWTLRPGDLVIHGDVSLTGTLEELEGACAGLPIGTVTKAEDLRIGLRGRHPGSISKWASILYVEAV